MTRVAFLLLLVVVSAGCQTGKGSSARTDERQNVQFAGGGGLSPAQAIVITGAGAFGAVDAERAWLNAHAPGARVGHQALLSEGDRSIDQLFVTLPGGGEKDYFFDITDSMKSIARLLGN
jgi:hypothetical protein